jgi:hypothetical protein
MIYKYYHLLWVFSFTGGFVLYRKFFILNKFKFNIDLLFFIILSFLIISVILFFSIKKLQASSSILLKTALILPVLMFSLLGFARYGLFFYMQDKNIFKLIYENET